MSKNKTSSVLSGKEPKTMAEWIILGVAIGLPVGAGIGVAIENIALGIAIGAALGPFISLAMAYIQKKRKQK